MGFGFSAAGLLFPYHVGIASALQDLSVIHPGRTHVAGASAGAIIAVCINAGLTTAQTMDFFLQLATDLRGRGVYRNLTAAVREVLEEKLPDDAHERCSGVTHIAVTRALPCALRAADLTTACSNDVLCCCLRMPLRLCCAHSVGNSYNAPGAVLEPCPCQHRSAVHARTCSH
jgi:hypothetical protein